MSMSLNEKGGICVFAVLLLIVGVFLYEMTGEKLKGGTALMNLGREPEAFETLPSGIFEGIDDKIYHFCPPKHIPNATYLPLRYPKFAGHNVTLLIHKGFSPMMKAAVKDPSWYDHPAAQMIGCNTAAAIGYSL